MAKTLRRPPIKGSADPELPDHVLVPVRREPPGFPKVNYSVPDGSFWRVDKRTNKPTAILTMTPSGMPLGWDNCGVCTGGLNVCECASGISLPNAIGYIFTTFGGTKPTPPKPQPLAAVFRAPGAPGKKKLRRKPQHVKKTLKRTSLDRVAEKEADAAIERTLKRLKR